MKRHVAIKLKQAQDKLGLIFPDQLFDFISRLDDGEVKFGEEEWWFGSVGDKPKDANNNYVVDRSVDFEKEWGLGGLIFADNGIGDYLVVLPLECGEQILVLMHESAELKLFSNNIQELVEKGPENYYWSDSYVYKLDDDNKLVKGEELEDESSDDDLCEDNKLVNGEELKDEYSDDDLYDADDKLRSYLDDLIDNQETKKSTEIVIGLEKLVENSDERHKVWALNKLSNIYLKGFGPIPKSLEKALDYNQQAIDLNSYVAYSNRAACYFFGFGLEKDIAKALELATKANELSKKNYFADILATKKGGGMYDDLVDMIKTEIKKQKSNSGSQ